MLMQKPRMTQKALHPYRMSSARDATCNHYNIKGHYSLKCLSRTMAISHILYVVDEKTIPTQYSDIIYLTVINHICTND